MQIGIDGCFSINRWKCGLNVGLPLTGNSYVLEDPINMEQSSLDQEEVNETLVHKKSSCGTKYSAIINAERNRSGLAITGIVGASCSHMVPLTFIRARRGEQYHLAVAVIQRIISEYRRPLLVGYDIACSFEKYLSNRHPEIRKDVAGFTVPAMHVMTHIPKCYVGKNVLTF